MAKFVQDGCAVDFVAPAALPAGSVVVQGDLVGVTSRPLAAGELGALAVEGIVEFPKASGAGTAIGMGVRVFWNAVTSLAVLVDGGGANKLIGKCVKAALDTETAVRVRLSQ